MNQSPVDDHRPGRRRLATLVSATVLALTAGGFTLVPGAASAADTQDATAAGETCLLGLCIPEVPGLPLPELPLPELPLPEVPGLPSIPGVPSIPELLELPGAGDTTPPDTAITSGPEQGATIDTASPTFGFSGTPAADVVGFECNLDGSQYIACESPTTLQNLAEGEHTFTVRAGDEVGNRDLSPATRTFIVETQTDPEETTFSPECIAAATDYLVARDKAAKRAKQVTKAQARLKKAKQAKQAKQTPKTKKKVKVRKRQLAKKRRNLRAAEADRDTKLQRALPLCQQS